MTDIKHTPLPWKKLSDAHKVIRIRSTRYKLADRQVADINRFVYYTGDVAHVDSFDTDDVMEANADFIVKACNSHYELLEALKEAYEDLACSSYPERDLVAEAKINESAAFTLRVRQIIAKAEGR